MAENSVARRSVIEPLWRRTLSEIVTLNLLIHHVPDISIEREEFLAWRKYFATLRDIALPVAGVHFGENWVAKH